VTPAIVACRYVIEKVRAGQGRRWLEGVRSPPLPCRSMVPEVRFVAERRMRGVPDEAARALVGWADGARHAVLLGTAPTPRELLALSAHGWRCVSLVDLEFVLHDLCHLEKFADPEHRDGQIGFFRLLERAMNDARWAAIEEGLDEAWTRERDHVMCDMNASPLFLWCGLRSRLAQACARASKPARLDLLIDLLQLPPDLARAVVSRYSSRVASYALARHFAAAGQT
jgi:hypothetical protein